MPVLDCQSRSAVQRVAKVECLAHRMQVRRSLEGAPLAEVPTGGEAFEEVSPCEGVAISQDVFEAVLRDHLARRPEVALSLGVELTKLTVTDPGRITATVRDHTSGSEQHWRPRYLLGTDGKCRVDGHPR